MKIIIIGNCQIQPLASGIQLHSGVEEVIQVPLHLKGGEFYRKTIDLINNSTDTYTVLAFNNSLSDIDFTPSTQSRFSKVLTFTNIFFRGLHPDLIYLGGMGDRLTSPVGDYHSLICALSFLKGLNTDQCREKFNQQVYERLGFFLEWDISAKMLLKRDENLDIQFAEDFIEMAREEPVLFTVNHPMPKPLLMLTNKILVKLELEPLKFPDQYYYNYLSNNTWWPIYPEIASKHEIKYDTSMIFKSPDHINRKTYNLDMFITKSFEIYERYGKDKIIKSKEINEKYDLL